MSRPARRNLVDRDGALSIRRQCVLMGISRSSVYYAPRGESAENLALMRRMDALSLQYPFYGSRQMARHLRREGGPPNKPAADADVQTGPARADGPVADEQLEVGRAPRPPRSARPWGRRWRPSGAASLAGDARVGTVATRGSRRWTAPGGSCAPFDPAAAVPS